MEETTNVSATGEESTGMSREITDWTGLTPY